MADANTVVTYVKAQIEANVSGYNKVYAYEREIRNYEQFATDFGTGLSDSSDNLPIAKGWTITATRRDTAEIANQGAASVTYTVQLECVWSVFDRGASEVDFRTHVEAVADHFDNKFSFGALPGILRAGPVQILEISHIRFGNQRLAHIATLNIPVRLQRIRTPV